MATTELKTLEKIVKEILEKVENIGKQKIDINYDDAFDKINTKLETIDEHLSVSSSADGIPAEIVSKVDEINSNFEEKSQYYIKEIQQAFDNFKQNQAEFISSDGSADSNIKDFTSIITNELLELKEQFEKFNTEFTDTSLNTGMAVSKEIVSLKNHVLALNDSVDNIKTKIEEYTEKEGSEESSEDSIITNVEEIYNSSFNSFKNDVYSVLAKITEASNEALNKIAEISKELKTFEELELSVGEIIQNQQKNKTEILRVFQNNIEEENKKLLPQIMQLVNSISFDESAEEIKDGLYAVNENLGIVNKNVESGSKSAEQILGQIDDISKTVNDSTEELTTLVKDDLVNKLSQMNNFLSEVSNDFAMLTKGTKSDTENYLYSLLDLEADISKVRVILDELNHTIQDDKSLAESITKNISDKISNLNNYVEQTTLLYSSPDYKEILMQFDALNEDISSISKRTNKLILTSDDASEKLQKNIEEFHKIMIEICEKVQAFEKSEALKNLVVKTENIQKLISNSVQSDKAINEAFVYLANWIDSTSEEIKVIKSGLSSIDDKINTVAQTCADKDSSDSSDMADVMKLLKETNKKLADNSKRIDSLETVVPAIENLSEQVILMNEQLAANKTMSKKIDKMEKQIQKLLSFVEEEEE